jgi:hypothetical protein
MIKTIFFEKRIVLNFIMHNKIKPNQIKLYHEQKSFKYSKSKSIKHEWSNSKWQITNLIYLFETNKNLFFFKNKLIIQFKI